MEFHCAACDEPFNREPNPAEIPFEVAGFDGVHLSGFKGRVVDGKMVIESAACPACGRLAPRARTAGSLSVNVERPSVPVPAEPITSESAFSNAARLLRNAEMITDLALMQRLESLADSWISIARTVIERDRG